MKVYVPVAAHVSLVLVEEFSPFVVGLSPASAKVLGPVSSLASANLSACPRHLADQSAQPYHLAD